MPYIFQSMKDTEKLTDSSKLYNFIEGFSDYENQFSLICGKIKALFGQPIYETENLENLFLYCILTISEEGEEIYLNIYCAGSGPAVGGMQDEKSRKAAKALVNYVWQAEPVNYTHKAYYLDGPSAPYPNATKSTSHSWLMPLQDNDNQQNYFPFSFLPFQTDAKISLRTKKASSSLYPYSFSKLFNNRSISTA